MRKLTGLSVLGGALCIMLGGCQGRTADNMVPTGETVRVEIPTDDVAADSAVAAGDIQPTAADAAH